MPWPLILLPSDEWFLRHQHHDPRLEPLQIGHCAVAPWVFTEDGYSHVRKALGSKYLALPEPRRAPIVIALPYHNQKYQIWFPDERAWDAKQGYHGEGWTITGDLPNISITPSINCVGTYHGYVDKGQITSDCEGRKFPLEPTP
jgi:hypothetical protein